jgi:hypothetical protein
MHRPVAPFTADTCMRVLTPTPLFKRLVRMCDYPHCSGLYLTNRPRAYDGCHYRRHFQRLGNTTSEASDFKPRHYSAKRRLATGDGGAGDEAACKPTRIGGVLTSLRRPRNRRSPLPDKTLADMRREGERLFVNCSRADCFHSAEVDLAMLIEKLGEDRCTVVSLRKPREQDRSIATAGRNVLSPR